MAATQPARPHARQAQQACHQAGVHPRGPPGDALLYEMTRSSSTPRPITEGQQSTRDTIFVPGLV